MKGVEFANAVAGIREGKPFGVQVDIVDDTVGEFHIGCDAEEFVFEIRKPIGNFDAAIDSTAAARGIAIALTAWANAKDNRERNNV